MSEEDDAHLLSPSLYGWYVTSARPFLRLLHRHPFPPFHQQPQGLSSLLDFICRPRNARGSCVGTHITTSSLCVPTSVDQGSVPAALSVATKPVSKQSPKSPAPLVQDQQASCPPPASGSRHVAPSGNHSLPKSAAPIPCPWLHPALAALLTANRVIFLWYQRTNKTFENSEKPSRRRCWKNPQESIAERIPCRARRSRVLSCPSALVLRDFDSWTDRSLPRRPSPATATGTYTRSPRRRPLGNGARMPHRGQSCASTAAAGLQCVGGRHGADGPTRGGRQRAHPQVEKPHQQRLQWRLPVAFWTRRPIPDGPEGKVEPCLKAVSPGCSPTNEERKRRRKSEMVEKKEKGRKKDCRPTYCVRPWPLLH